MKEIEVNVLDLARRLCPGQEVAVYAVSPMVEISHQLRLYRFNVDGEEDELHLLVDYAGEAEAIFNPQSRHEHREKFHVQDYL